MPDRQTKTTLPSKRLLPEEDMKIIAVTKPTTFETDDGLEHLYMTQQCMVV